MLYIQYSGLEKLIRSSGMDLFGLFCWRCGIGGLDRFFRRLVFVPAPGKMRGFLGSALRAPLGMTPRGMVLRLCEQNRRSFDCAPCGRFAQDDTGRGCGDGWGNWSV